MADVQVAMFDTDRYRTDPEAPPPKVSPDVRRRQRQADALAHGWHPLFLSYAAHLRPRLHPDAAPADNRAAPGRRCGNCWYRHLIYTNGNRRWPKCLYGAENPTDTAHAYQPRVTHGAGTDVAAWWPGCEDHSYGDPRLSRDAARHTGVADAGPSGPQRPRTVQ